MNRQQPSPWPIIGHELAVSRLSWAVYEEQVAHAYLISGPDHIGKQTVAHTFAQALLCTNEHSRPCTTCRTCNLVQTNHHADFIRLDLAWQAQNLPEKSKSKFISVDAVRMISRDLTRRPLEGRWKILIVPHVDEFTLAASNAFLKTLEEPPSFVVILLTTHDAHLVLPTIRSRCQPIFLFPLALEKVEEALVNDKGLTRKQARFIAKISGGRIGWAIKAAENKQLLEKRASILASLQQALKSNRAERLLQAVPLSKENDIEVIRLWAGWWRDLLLIQNNAAEVISNIDQQEQLQKAAQRYSTEQVRSFLHELQRLLRILRHTNVNTQLLWEVLLLKLPHYFSSS